jgi:enoyl-CoA hydratase
VCVERANLDPAVHVIALAGNGAGFCGGYDLVEFVEGAGRERADDVAPGSPLDPEVQARNHDLARPWDPVVDYQMMSRNVRGFMSLFHSEKPVVCKVHGFCVAGGTDMALCADLLVIASDARIGYPPARAWGGSDHRAVGPPGGSRACQAPAVHRRPRRRRAGTRVGTRDRRAPARRARRPLRGAARARRADPGQPAGDDEAAREPGPLRRGLHATQLLGTLLDGMARHTPEGYAFQRRAGEAG